MRTKRVKHFRSDLARQDGRTQAIPARNRMTGPRLHVSQKGRCRQDCLFTASVSRDGHRCLSRCTNIAGSGPALCRRFAQYPYCRALNQQVEYVSANKRDKKESDRPENADLPGRMK